MKTYEVHRAQDSGPDKVEPATLALKHLPGGTIDALLVLLLDDRRSHLIIQIIE